MTTLPQLVGGDDWEFKVTLLDIDGNPYNLSGNPPIEWVMRHGMNPVVNTGDVSISLTDPTAGKLSVFVPSVVTTTLKNFAYNYSLRVVIGGVTHTPLIGKVQVYADPFLVAASVTSATRRLALVK